VVSLAGLGILGVVGYFGGQLAAQQPPYQPPPRQPIQPVSATQPAQPGMPAPGAPTLRTRIALINLAEVMKHYAKAKTIADDVGAKAKTIDNQELLPIRNKLIQLRTQLQTADAGSRDKIEADMRRLQLDLQEREEDARKRMTKLGGDYMVQLYREVEDAVRHYARISDIELVLFYMDPTDPANPYDPATIQARLQTRGALPMYAAAGMDITAGVGGLLNDRYRANQAAAHPGGQPR
jgi:Skp family chaperone for outer membrane proteins